MDKNWALGKKYRWIKSGDRGGQETSPERDINLPGKAFLSIAVVSPAVLFPLVF